jgi:hypothetical protein
MWDKKAEKRFVHLKLNIKRDINHVKPKPKHFTQTQRVKVFAHFCPNIKVVIKIIEASIHITAPGDHLCKSVARFQSEVKESCGCEYPYIINYALFPNGRFINNNKKASVRAEPIYSDGFSRPRRLQLLLLCNALVLLPSALSWDAILLSWASRGNARGALLLYNASKEYVIVQRARLPLCCALLIWPI